MSRYKVVTTTKEYDTKGRLVKETTVESEYDYPSTGGWTYRQMPYITPHPYITTTYPYATSQTLTSTAGGYTTTTTTDVN